MSKRDQYAIESWSEAFLSALPQFKENVSRGATGKSSYIRHSLPNPYSQRFPLVVTMYDVDGVYVDLGERISVVEQACFEEDGVIDTVLDILQDKVIVAAVYENEHTYHAFQPKMEFIWYDCDNPKENSMKAYRDFVRKTTHPTLFTRFWAKGIIEISDWTGKRYQKIIHQ